MASDGVAAWEAGLADVETSIRYKGQDYAYVIEEHMFTRTVAELKRTLLSLKMLDCVTETPEQLGLFVTIPPSTPLHRESLEMMKEDKKVGEYKDHITSCSAITLREA